jgi:hypothetical protein
MTLTPFADGIWIDSEPVQILGMPLSVNMTALRLADRDLLLYSPIKLTAERRAAVESLGRVAHLYAPNVFHHRWIGEWAEAFPSARLHAPAGLSSKRRDLRVDRTHAAGVEPAFSDLIREQRIEGFRLDECVLVYQPARTLVVADLVQNVGRPRELWSKLYTRTMGFYDRVALSRVIRWTGFSDRAAARKSLDQLLAIPFDGLIVGHGAALTRGGKEALEQAFSWLA